MFYEERELQKNINTDFGIASELQQILSCHNAQFMINLARELNLSYTIPTLALHVANHFYQKKAYLNYDRFLICAACLLISSKLKNMDIRLKNLCNSFYKLVSSLTNSIEPFNEEKMSKLKDYVSIYESEVLRTLEFEIESTTPHEYLRREMDVNPLPPTDKEITKRIFTTTRILILDSYRSRCCLVYSSLTIFLCCYLIANRYQGRMPFHSKIVLQKCQENPSQQNRYESWLSMVSERQGEQISSFSVKNCLKMINSVLATCSL